MGEYARAVLTSDDVSIKVIDTEPLKKAAHELAKQGTNLNQFMKFLNTYGVKVFDPDEAKRVLEKEVSTFSEIMEALAALRREADGSGIPIFANGYRREHGTEPKVTGNRKLSESDILSGMGAVSVKIDS